MVDRMHALALTLSWGWDVTRYCLRFTVSMCHRGQDNLRLYDQAARIISTGKLNGLPHLHTQPINDVVYIVPLGESSSREISS